MNKHQQGLEKLELALKINYNYTKENSQKIIID